MKRRALLLLAMAAPLLGTLHGSHAQDATKPFKPEELDQMLAPLALYPDALLAQTLMAASYPLEVVDAARWSKANPTLKGDAAVAAVKDKSWDVSVKSLTAFPQVLVRMSDHLDWMQKVGDAMVAQQQDVADSIQRLRARAADAGNLTSGKEQTVSSQGTGADRTIVIVPTNPEVVYVPVYPSSVYGAWPNTAYPPTYYPPPAGYGYGSALLKGLLFGIGVAAASAMFGGWNWGRGNSYVNVNVNKAVNIDRTFNAANINNGAWRHDAVHRKGVPYRDAASRERFGQVRPGADRRQEFRGRIENRPANAPVAQRPQAGNRGGGLNGVDRGQQVNREAARGRAQQSKASGHTGGGAAAARGGGGGGGGAAAGAREGGGGGRGGQQ